MVLRPRLRMASRNAVVISSGGVTIWSVGLPSH